jgi:hypothetical protein
MKSSKDILKELGFRPDSPMQTQKIFLKHLQMAANISRAAHADFGREDKNKNISSTANKTELKTKTLDESLGQLSFDFMKDKRVS